MKHYSLVLICLILASCGPDKKNEAPRSPAASKPSPIVPPSPSSTPPSDAIKPLAPYTDLVDQKQINWKNWRYSSRQFMPHRNYSWNPKPPQCSGDQACEGRYVRLEISIGRESFNLTGVLIAPDIILTNRHGAELLGSEENQAMRGTAIAIFPNGNTYEVISVLGMSPIEYYDVPTLKMDYAFLKVKPLFTEKPTPKPVVINRNGFVAGKKYFVYSHAPNGTDIFTVTKKTCLAEYSTIFGPKFDRPTSPVVVLADCPIGPGNSGSGIFDEYGQLVGLISGQISPSTVAVVSEYAKDYLKVAKEKFKYVGWGNNLSCIPDIETFQPLAKSCNDYFSGDWINSLLTVSDEKWDSARQKVGKIADDNVFKFELRQNRDNRLTQFVHQTIVSETPICVKRSALANLQDTTNVRSLKFVSPTIDSLGRVSAQWTQVQTLPDSFILVDAEKLRREGQANFIVGGFSDRIGFNYGKLGVCEE